MSKIIGIDIGGSTTKIVGYINEKMVNPILVKANDPIASVYGAFGKFLSSTGLELKDIDRVMITGVGSSFIDGPLYGVPTGKIEEFQAIGMGGLYLSNLTKAIIVSMGTGTALVRAYNNKAEHIGGTGVGGGTLLGLSNLMINVRDFNSLIETAQDGNLANIDLTIGDISQDEVSNFTPDTTASNFGKISDLATPADIALGIINLVFQVIGMISIFASKIDNTQDIVLTGNLTNVPQAKDVFRRLTDLYGINFHIPVHAEFATAIGAAIAYSKNIPYKEITKEMQL